MTMGVEQLLIELVASLSMSAATKGFRHVLKSESDVMRRAIEATASRFSEIEGTERSLNLWISTDTFVEFFERIYDGERQFDHEIVSSFLKEGDFFHRDEKERRKLGATIVASFISESINCIYRSKEGLPAFARRQERLHVDTKSHFDSGLADLKTDLPSIISSALAQAKLIEPGKAQYSLAQHHLSARTDAARDLINSGYVHSARVLLEQLNKEALQEPDEIKFRIATNLGACALAEEDFDRARTYLEEAYRLQSTNPKAIANAAVAAQINGDSEGAMHLALKARELEPKNSQATAVFIVELWNARKGERLESLMAEESWIVEDKQCKLVLSKIRMKQSRFDEAVELCRSLVEDDRKDATASLALSQSLLNYVQENLPLARYTTKSVVLLREAKEEASRALCILEPTELRAQSREAFLTRSCANALLGATAEALADLERVLSEAPFHDEALFNKGKLLLFHEDKPAEARAILESIQECRLRKEAVVPLAVACINSGDHEAAVKLLKETFTLENPGWEDVGIAEQLYRTETALGNGDSVGPILKAALQRSPSDPKDIP